MGFLGHTTVLKNELVEQMLECSPDAKNRVFADLTLGGAGHSLELLKRDPLCKVIGFDQDQDALNEAKKLFEKEGVSHRVKLCFSNFSEISSVIESSRDFINGKKLNGVMADIGVSSHQFDQDSRGFSFRFDGPLDMRMNQSSDLNAELIVNEYRKEELIDIFFKYGEEKLSKIIAENIISERLKERIKTTKQLENIIFHSYPKKWRFGRTHPATKVFQALRIYVNKELDVLESVIPLAFNSLTELGRLGIITFHSLEDRIVKHSFREIHKRKEGRLIQRKSMLPSEEEIKMNPRSRSAKLRVVEKVTREKGD